MQLLVSVASGVEAKAALDGGADIVDAKDPLAGALGAVSPDTLHEIVAAVDGARPVTAALGDASDEASVEQLARRFASAGASLVKVGFAGTQDIDRVNALLAAAQRGALRGGGGVVAVAYADADRAGSLAPARLLDAAADATARGVLLDTACKSGPGLRGLTSDQALASWVSRAHQQGLVVALAGKLTADDLTFVRDAGADIAGVRGAACRGGRTGSICADHVRALRGRLSHRHADVVDLVVKLGGGLLEQPDQFGRVLGEIDAAAATSRLLIVPGGGPFADTVRAVDRQFQISNDAAHWMAILGMDQYAHLIASKLSRAQLARSLDEVTSTVADGRIAVLAPSRWLYDADPLPHGWEVTSDSIAAWIAGQLEVRRFVLIKPPGAHGADVVDPFFSRALPPELQPAIVPADRLDALRLALRR
jgi:uncharacterized protein (UPF0264 family)/aspartokinase-like uncharacterized kinase